MSDDPDFRRQGVDLGGLEEELAGVDYPVTAAELSDTFGDRLIDMVDDEERFDSLLEPYLKEMDDEVVFDSHSEVQNEIMNLVGSGAVGREGYSDRGLELDDRARDEESI